MKMQSYFLVGCALMCLFEVAFGTLFAKAQADINVANADASKSIGLASNPSLTTVLSSVAVRIGINQGDAVRQLEMANVPTEFKSLLDAVTARVTFHYADANREMLLGYPKVAINDTTPPAFVTPPQPSGASITWTSDEYAIGELSYGTQSGVYIETLREASYTKLHTFSISNLQQEQAYFIKAAQSNLSGLRAERNEEKLDVAAQRFVYLPLTRR